MPMKTAERAHAAGAAPPLNVAVFQQSHSAAFAMFSDDGKPQHQPAPSSSSSSSQQPPPYPQRRMLLSGGSGSGPMVNPGTTGVLNHSFNIGSNSNSIGANNGNNNSNSAIPTSTQALQPPQPQQSTVNVSSSSTSPEVLLSGSLSKRGHFFKNWLPRHFVLSKLSLNYYRKNPLALQAQMDKEDAAALEKKWLKGELFRGDVIRVEATDIFKNRPFCFVVVVRKRSRRSSNLSALTCIPSSLHQHLHLQKESSLSGAKPSGGKSSAGDDGPVVLYYIQASREQERQKWIKTLERWIDGECPAKIGRSILQYIVSNEYSSYRYEQKRGDRSVVGFTSGDSWTAAHGGNVSPAAQAGRTVEQDFPVLANLIRDMNECQQEDEMVYILDQILGEVQDGASSSYIKKLIASAGEVKLESSPQVWTVHVKFAYAKIMKTLRAQNSNKSLHQRKPVGGRPSPTSSSLSRRPPRLQIDSRQNSYGVDSCTSEADASAPDSFHKFYKLGRKLGSGAFSVVHIATHRETRKQVAVKCIAKTSLADLDAKALKQEVEIMKKLDHVNLVPLLDYYEESRYYFIVTPLCTGGELFDDLVKRKSYTEEDARVLMGKLASAIQYIHSRGIVHRDLKPENILLKTSAPGAEVMIADFGFARSMTGSRRGTACGTPGYVAPEVVQGRPYGSEVDCWSLGVILFILLCGYPPFPGSNHAAILDKVVNADFEFESPFWDHVSEEAKDLVKKLLTVDPEKRLAASDILTHAWMTPPVTTAPENGEEKSPLRRVCSTDLLPALLQMRKHSLTHENPKIRPSDMNVDALELGEVSMDRDVELLDRELGKVYEF
ncbi:Camk/camk1 protein kinase [Globisporangium polare]